MTMSTAQRNGGRGLRLRLLAEAGALMLLPVLGLRLVGRLDPDPGAFVFLAILFTGMAITVEVAARVPRRAAYAAGAGLAVATSLLLLWINLSVGVIGSEDDPANLIYVPVIVTGIVGALLAHFRPAGMASAMTATAVTQTLVFALALIGGLGFTGPITVFFDALWLTSAWLFRRADSGADP